MGKHVIIAFILAISAGLALADSGNGKGSGHGNGIGSRQTLQPSAPSPEKAPTAARSYRYSGR